MLSLLKHAAFVVLLLSVSMPSSAQPQISDDPADAATQSTLTYTTNAGNLNVLTTACTTGSLNPSSGDFSLALAPVGAATSSAAGGLPGCGNFFTPPPAAAAAANDAWFRIDPPATPHRFRVTLLGNTLTDGAMAIYEAPSAAGPFRLLECAFGGSSVTLSQTHPTLEAASYTPGNKLFVRVWNQSDRSSSGTFKLCVQGQADATMVYRGAEETPCPGTPMVANTYYSVDYVFANNETPWLFAEQGNYVGGDLWLKLTVPASGTVGAFIYRGAPSPQHANYIGVSAYTASNCADPATYRQVGNFSGMLGAVAPTTANLAVSCLAPGTTLYLRIHSILLAQNYTQRYGKVRIKYTAGPVTGAPPSNNLPCGATPLTFTGSCPVGTTPLTSNTDACNTPGIPTPGCGGFDGNSRDVWYSFVAPASGTVHIEASPYGVSFPANPAIALYTTGGHGCNGRFTLMECDDRQGLGVGAAIIRTGLVPGQTYYVRAWAEDASAASGQFTMCIREPIPPAGSCFYVIDLLAIRTPIATTYQGVQAQINGGPPIDMITPTGGDASQIWLLPVPAGATLTVQYFNQDVGEHWRTFYQLGDTARLWSYHGGIAVVGPTPGPVITYTIPSACAPIPRPTSDCLGAETVCTPNTEFGGLLGSLPQGNTFDLNGTNMGCLSSDEDAGIAWLIFRPIEDGTVAFWFDANTNAATSDLDFAIWDAGLVNYTPSLPNISGAICAPNGPPVRCSSARRFNSTGLQPGLEGVYNEGNAGWGWLSPLPVIQDHVYLVALVRGAGTPQNVQYQMRWTLTTNASGVTSTTMLNCTPLILPMELLYLQAETLQDAVLLEWATGSEKNSSRFLVERSRDGEVFQPIGSVAAAGHSIQLRDYSFVDEEPFTGLNYYRLRLYDLDGSSTLSNVVVAMFGREQGPVLVYPNPVNDILHLSVSSDDKDGAMSYRIFDGMGRLVSSNFIAANRTSPVTLNVDMLSSGMYVLNLMDEKERFIGSSRFVKQ